MVRNYMPQTKRGALRVFIFDCRDCGKQLTLTFSTKQMALDVARKQGGGLSWMGARCPDHRSLGKGGNSTRRIRNEVDEKFCNRCMQWKPVECFTARKAPNGKSYPRPHCVVCVSAYLVNWRRRQEPLKKPSRSQVIETFLNSSQ